MIKPEISVEWCEFNGSGRQNPTAGLYSIKPACHTHSPPHSSCWVDAGDDERSQRSAQTGFSGETTFIGTTKDPQLETSQLLEEVTKTFSNS